jgi:hypothetical protein
LPRYGGATRGSLDWVRQLHPHDPCGGG